MDNENEFQNLNKEDIKQVAGGTDSQKQIYEVDGSWAPPADCDKYHRVRNEYPGDACCNCEHFRKDNPHEELWYMGWGNCYRDFD